MFFSSGRLKLQAIVPCSPANFSFGIVEWRLSPCFLTMCKDDSELLLRTPPGMLGRSGSTLHAFLPISG